MESLLKTELVNIILFSTYLDGSIPLDDECIQLRTSCHSTFKKAYNSKKKKEKRFGCIHLLTQASEAHYG